MQCGRESGSGRQRVAFLFNPASGQAGEDRRVTLETLAQAAGLTCALQETDETHGAGPLARAAVADRVERVLVSGGDGSVSEAAGALVGTGVALAVIPGGTGNLLAINTGIPREAAAALEVALNCAPRAMDVGRANLGGGKDGVFLIMVGIGADARMIREADRQLKNRYGVLAYFIAALRAMRHPPNLYRVTIDGRVWRRRAQTVLVANLGRVNGGVELVPNADPDDGQLEVAILRAEGFLDILRLALRVLMHRPSRNDLLEVHRGRRIVIESRRAQPVQLDGNDAGSTTRLEVVVEPRALLLVQPEVSGP